MKNYVLEYNRDGKIGDITVQHHQLANSFRVGTTPNRFLSGCPEGGVAVLCKKWQLPWRGHCAWEAQLRRDR